MGSESSGSATVLDAFKSHLFIHASDLDSTEGEVISSAMAESVGRVFADYYMDANYGVTGGGASVEAPKYVFIASPPPAGSDDTLFKSDFDYGAVAAELLSDTSDHEVDSKWFETIADMSNFVRAVAYQACDPPLEWWEPGLGYDAKAADPMPRGQTKEKASNQPAVKGIFAVEGADGKVSPTSKSSQRNSRAYQAMLTKTKEKFGSSGGAAAADANFDALRLWLAYQYIDHAPIATAGDYDSFLEIQVRQLTKVVFVAKILQAASEYSAGSSSGDAASPGSPVTYFNKVMSLPYNDATMLGPFLDPKNDTQYLDNMYRANVDTSARLYDTAQELESKDMVMRRVQDNLRSINSNDELIRIVRRRAFIGYVVVGVLMLLVGAALFFTLVTGRSSLMYVVVSIVCLVVLVAESLRGVDRILRLML